MRSYEASGGTHFNYNGDFSGDVHICAIENEWMAIPFEDMKELVVEWIRQTNIRFLENATTEEILEKWNGNGNI